jgi:hypothetical protein
LGRTFAGLGVGLLQPGLKRAARPTSGDGGKRSVVVVYYYYEPSLAYVGTNIFPHATSQVVRRTILCVHLHERRLVACIQYGQRCDIGHRFGRYYEKRGTMSRKTLPRFGDSSAIAN